jgi:hypothetical protein
MQLKEWGYEKYLRKSEAALITAKTQKQSREEAQEAVFFHGEVTISYERITNFKLRTLSCRDSGNDPEGPSRPIIVKSYVSS